MHDNPLFVEDVTRNLLLNAAQEFKELNLNIDATTTSLESIHKHNVISKGSTSTYPEIKAQIETKMKE
jgi:GTP cyclohydrolase FolE2